MPQAAGLRPLIVEAWFHSLTVLQMRLLVYEALGRDFLLVIRFSRVSVISPMFDTHRRLNITLIGRNSGRNLGNTEPTIVREDWTETVYLFFFSSGATALQGFGRQSSRRRLAKLVPTFADGGVSRGQRNGSPRPLISVYRTWIATYFIQAAHQLTSRGSVHPVPDPLPLRKSGSTGNRTRDLCIYSQKP